MNAPSRLLVSTLAILAAVGIGHWLGNHEHYRLHSNPGAAETSEKSEIVRPLGHSMDRAQRPAEASPLAAAQKHLPDLISRFLRWDDWQARADIEHLLSDLSAEDLDILVRDLDPATLGANGRTVLSMAFSHLARRDRALAQAYIRDLAVEVQTLPPAEASVLKSQLINFSIADPRGALELADSWENSSSENQELLHDLALGHLAEVDLALFRTRFAELDETRRARILRGLADPESDRSTLVEVGRLAGSLSLEGADEIFSLLAETIYQSDPDEALALMQEWELPENHRSGIDVCTTSNLLREGSDEDCQKALAGYLQRNPEQANWRELEHGLQSWCERSPAAYVEWLDTLQDGPVRDTAASAAAGSRIWLPQAEAFASVIGDASSRSMAEETVKRRRDKGER